MRKLIINADDLGISNDVDDVIEKCIQKGVVTSCTLMANAPAFDDGVRIGKKYTNVSIGVHLNIIQFAPLTNVDVFKKHGVVGDDGQFVVGAIFHTHIDEELKQAIFEEWDAQIKKVKDAGIIPTHCDSHQHAHTIPALRKTLSRVLDKQGIRSIRRTMTPSIRLTLRLKKRPQITFNKSKSFETKKRSIIYRRVRYIVNQFIILHWNSVMSKRYRMTNSFFALRYFLFDKDVLNLSGKEATIELMCHPGHKSYQIETDYLMSGNDWIPEGYKLISYKEI